DRLQVEMAIRNMDRQQAVRCQFLEIKLNCFAGDEVNRNGVGAEGIDGDQAVLLVGRLFELDAGIAESKVKLSTAADRVLPVSEVAGLLGNVDDRGIDFVKGGLLPGLDIGRQRASAETDERQMLRLVRAHDSQDAADRAVAVVV